MFDLNWILQIFQDPNLQGYFIGISSGVIGSIIAASVIGHYHRKNLEFTTLTRIFDILGNKEHREARSCVFRAFEKFVKQDEPDMSIYEAIEDKTEIVRADYDQIGLLIYKSIKRKNVGKKYQDKYLLFWFNKGYLPKNSFFEAYAGSVVNSWYALQHFIEYQRNKKFSKERFMLFFEHLAKDAYRFHKVRGESNVQRLKNKYSGKLDKWLKKLKDDQT